MLMRIIKTVLLLLSPFVLFTQTQSEITTLEEDHAFKYIRYYEDGSIHMEIGFYTKRPYASIDIFEEKLDAYKIKEHGPSIEYFPNGQIKEIVVYRKGRVVELAKYYFEDGEEYSVVVDIHPTFQFEVSLAQTWFNDRISEIEERIGHNLEGSGFIVLEIDKDGNVRNSLVANSTDENNNEYLIEIANQIRVLEPAVKDGQIIGTRFGFRVHL